MSITKRIFFGAAASWVSRGLTIVLGLVLMPVLFRTLPKEELGLWLLLGQSAAVLGVLDFGFGVTLTRRLAFARGKSGTDPNAPISGESRSEIADLVTTGLRVYRVLALLAFLISLGLGFLYLRSVELGSVPLGNVWTAWAVLSLSYALNFWAAPWTCLLQGVGHVGWDALISSFSGAITLFLQIVFALLGGGLVTLALVAAAGSMIQRIVILTFARRKQPDLFELRGAWRSDWFREMAPLAWRAWLTALGTTLILYTDQFVITSMEGTAELPAYRAAWTIVHNFTVVAVTFAAASGVFVSHLWQAGELGPLRGMVERNIRFGWLISGAGAAVLLFAGEDLFNVWLGPGNFIGYPVLIAFLVTEALEAQSYIVSTMSRATGDEAFGWSTLIAGVLKLSLSIAFAARFGLPGIAFGTLVALLFTNHWFVPWRGFRRLQMPILAVFIQLVLPILVWFTALCGLAGYIHGQLAAAPAWTRLVVTCLVSAIAFFVALWILVLDRGQRSRILTRLRIPALLR